MRKVVANTTPLIALADIGQLELLHKLYGEILIPETVFNEVESEPARTMVSKAETAANHGRLQMPAIGG